MLIPCISSCPSPISYYCVVASIEILNKHKSLLTLLDHLNGVLPKSREPLGTQTSRSGTPDCLCIKAVAHLEKVVQCDFHLGFAQCAFSVRVESIRIEIEVNYILKMSVFRSIGCPV